MATETALHTLRAHRFALGEVAGPAGGVRHGPWTLHLSQYDAVIAAVEELAAAMAERMAMSARGRKSTGPYAESDARIEAALEACGVPSHD